MAKKSRKTRKKSMPLIICVFVLLLLSVGFIILLFVIQDFGNAITWFLAVLPSIIAIIALKLKIERMYVCLSICAVLLILDALMAGWIVQKNREEESTVNVVTSVKENGSIGENDSDMENLEKTVQKDFELQEDHFVKYLDEYMKESGSSEDLIRKLIVAKLEKWAEEWDVLTLGDAGEGYSDQRTLIDEIYTIRILPEMESITLKEKAIEDIEWVIRELDVAYGIWPSPDLQREKALRYLESGDLCQKLGRYDEARKQYEAGIDVLWDGLEHSFQYGMLSTANNILDSLAESYENIGGLPETAIDDWDRGRAKLLAELFTELSVNPDPE